MPNPSKNVPEVNCQPAPQIDSHSFTEREEQRSQCSEHVNLLRIHSSFLNSTNDSLLSRPAGVSFPETIGKWLLCTWAKFPGTSRGYTLYKFPLSRDTFFSKSIYIQDYCFYYLQIGLWFTSQQVVQFLKFALTTRISRFTVSFWRTSVLLNIQHQWYSGRQAKLSRV